MVQYIGGEKYEVNIGNMKGEFSVYDLLGLMNELQEHESFSTPEDKISDKYWEGYEEAENIYSWDYSDGFACGKEEGIEEAQDRFVKNREIQDKQIIRDLDNLKKAVRGY